MTFSGLLELYNEVAAVSESFFVLLFCYDWNYTIRLTAYRYEPRHEKTFFRVQVRHKPSSGILICNANKFSY